MANIPVALQLFTVRELLQLDFAGTIQEVAKIGYRYVELAGLGNLKSAKKAREALDKAKLTPIAAHVGMEELEKDIDAVARDARTLGYWNLIVPSIPQQRRQDAAGWKQAAQTMGDRAAECHRRGFELAYHNHAFEFTLFDGKSGFDIFWGASDYKLLKSELDVYWVARGGADPVAWIKRLSGRLLAVHLKDMASGADSKFAPVGSGILDMTAILAAAKAAGAHFQVVEQDNTYGTNPLEAARESLENLKHWGAV